MVGRGGSTWPVSQEPEALLQLSVFAFDLALGLGPVWPAGAGHRAQQFAEVDPLRDEQRTRSGVVAEHRVAVGEQLPGDPAEVVEAAHQALETHLARAAGGDPDRGHAAVPEDRHHGVELDQFLPERPAPDVLPVGLGLDTGQRLEAHLGLTRGHGRSGRTWRRKVR